MNKEEITEKAQELTIKNVTDGKNKYFSWGFYKGCVVGLEYNNKQITELEEKNRELGDRLCNVANNLLESWCRNEEDYCPHLAELEEENAELKSEKGCETCTKFDEVKLTKAKEIIRDLLSCLYSVEYDRVSDLEEAEQFISEVKQ